MDFMLLLILLWEDAILERSEKIFPQAETFWREEIKSSFWVVSIHLDKTMLSAWPFNTLHFLLPSPFVHELPPVVPIMSCPPSLYCSPLAVITAQSFSQLLFHDHPTICVLLVPPLGELPSFTRAVFLSSPTFLSISPKLRTSLLFLLLEFLNATGDSHWAFFLRSEQSSFYTLICSILWLCLFSPPSEILAERKTLCAPNMCQIFSSLGLCSLLTSLIISKPIIPTYENPTHPSSPAQLFNGQMYNWTKASGQYWPHS